MNREPIGLYIFRFILGLGLFAFMAMLYWSSVLIEAEVKDLRLELEQISNELFILHGSIEKNRSGLIENLTREKKFDQKTAEGNSQKSASNTLSSFPNLLKNDPFYATTLPKLLGPNYKPQGTFHSAIVGKPDNLHPFSNWAQVAGWNDQCTVSVARMEFGKYETFAPYMAIKVEERENPEDGKKEFWIFLRDEVYWQPLERLWFSENTQIAPIFLRKHKVTAEDYKFYYDAVMNPFVEEAGAVALRTYLYDIEEVRVIDPLTFVVRWKSHKLKLPNGKTSEQIKYIAKQLTGSLKPLPSFVYKYFPDGKKIIENDTDPDTYRKNSVWAQQFSHHWAKNIIISCGPWTFDGMTDRQIKFKRNPNHFIPFDALAEASEVRFKESPDTIWEDFTINQLDAYELRPDQLQELKKFLNSKVYESQKVEGAEIKRLDFVSRTYSYIGWNQARPYFSSKKVRQALTMAVDRARIIRQTLNGMGIEINGPFYRYSTAYDPSIQPWPYDPEQARHLLEEEGWYDRSGTGVIEKIIDGKPVPFIFTLAYYVKNPTTKAICEYVATALKEINISCKLNGVDIADLSALFEGKDFDAICLGWSLGNPPEDPRQLWHSSGAKEQGSSNAIGFANAEADSIIDALDYEPNPEKRMKLYHRFDQVIHQEAPYIFLFTPKTGMIYRERLKNVFIPAEMQDLIPGANVTEPQTSIFYLKN